MALRRESTESELLLWECLQSRSFRSVKFRRQHAIGRYVVDFCAPAKMLVIELDGSQHLEKQAQDSRRTEDLVAPGYRVLRFWNNNAANDVAAVLRATEAELDARAKTSASSDETKRRIY